MFESSYWVTYPIRKSSVSFKKHFILNKEVKNVFIFITSMGFYHLYINNKRVDKDFFSPGFTEFDCRVQYQKYNITKFIKKDIDFNCELGEGWGGGDSYGWVRNEFLYYPLSLIFEINVEYVDGTKEVLISDESLDCTTNKIIESTIYNGEIQDEFAKIEYLGKAKKIDIKTEFIPQIGERIVTGERFKAKRIFKDKKNNLVIDFGQNFAGYVEINIKGKKGDVISFTPCEILDREKVFYNENYRSAKSFYKFTLTGQKDKFIPKFSFLGGRYIKLIDYPPYIKKEHFTAVFVHSNIKRTGYFKCGNKLVNRLYLNVIYGQLSNYLDIPTDCPQRDERIGWAGDAQVFASTGAINFNISKFMKKFLGDYRLLQGNDGASNLYAPRPNFVDKNHVNTSIGWGDAISVIPYEMYFAYNDKSFIKDNIQNIEKWILYIESKCKKNSYIPFLDFSYGDWLALDKIQEGERFGLTRFDLISTAYYALNVKILAFMRKELGFDNKDLLIKLENIKKAYQDEFIKDGHMVGEKALLFSTLPNRTAYTQTGIVMTLYLDLCKESDKQSLTNDLIQLINDSNHKMTTGFLGTPWLLHALCQNNKFKEACDLFLEDGFPSWLYSVKMGATTMWEHYDGINEDGKIWHSDMNSFNHYAYGSVFSYVYKYLVGINIIKPGYKEILISPHPDKRLGFINASYLTKYGKIIVKWKFKKNNKVEYIIKVPKNIKVNILLEDGYHLVSDSGVNLIYED